MGKLIHSGKLRAWGVLNWSAEQIAEADREARAQGVPAALAAQLPYSLARREPAEAPEMIAACEASGVSIVASSTLASGVLSGKYGGPEDTGRVADQLDNPRHQKPLQLARKLNAVAARIAEPPAAVAIAYALANPLVASVLFGATSPEQVRQNCRALEVQERLGGSVLEELRALA